MYLIICIILFSFVLEHTFLNFTNKKLGSVTSSTGRYKYQLKKIYKAFQKNLQDM